MAKSLYGRVDEAIMSGVNKGVKAWNWTTGRTKADLANVSNIAATTTYTLYSISSKDIAPYVFLPLVAGVSLVNIKSNIYFEKKEVKALENGLKDMQVEIHKEIAKIEGSMNMGCSAVIFTMPDYKFLSLTSLFWGLQDYITRAEYLPPKKNVVSRAADKIGEYLRESVRAPLPARAYVGSGNFRLSLEEATAGIAL